MIQIFDEIEQGTPDWFECRRGIPTASKFATVMAKGEGKTRSEYMRKLAGEILDIVHEAAVVVHIEPFGGHLHDVGVAFGFQLALLLEDVGQAVSVELLLLLLFGEHPEDEWRRHLQQFADGCHVQTRRLRKAGLRMELDPSERRTEGGPLDGSTLVLTGTLPDLTREEATKLIKRAGGKVVSSVSKKTDYVVAGDSPGSKLAKAEELGVAVVDEKGLRRLVR